jgi:hypothetical protein
VRDNVAIVLILFDRMPAPPEAAALANEDELRVMLLARAGKLAVPAKPYINAEVNDRTVVSQLELAPPRTKGGRT